MPRYIKWNIFSTSASILYNYDDLCHNFLHVCGIVTICCPHSCMHREFRFGMFRNIDLSHVWHGDAERKVNVCRSAPEIFTVVSY